MKKQISIIGCGALAGILANIINENLQEHYELAGAYSHHYEKTKAFAEQMHCRAYQTVSDMMDDGQDYIVELAGTAAVRECAPQILDHGISMIIASIGALADENLYRDLESRAKNSGAILYIASGAIGGFDLMRAVSMMEKPRVSIHNTKAPGSLNGAPALGGKNLPEDRDCEVFSGNAKEAIEGFPKNTNVCVAAALATVGTKEADVYITSSPNLKENVHRIDLENSLARASILIASSPDPANPKSSTLTAWSIAALLQNLTSSIRYF